MDHVSWVIKVLDDSRRKSIEYENRCWLYQNVEPLNIVVCIEDCLADIFLISRHWVDKNYELSSMVIQGGKEIINKNDFNFREEALLITRYDTNEDAYVFLYSPEK